MAGKISHIILSLLLLASTVGVTFSTHYCDCTMSTMEKVQDISHGNHDCCAGVPCKSCENHQFSYKIKNSYVNSAKPAKTGVISPIDLFGMMNNPYQMSFYETSGRSFRKEYVSLHAPPPFPEVTQNFLC